MHRTWRADDPAAKMMGDGLALQAHYFGIVHQSQMEKRAAEIYCRSG
jgi:hypothetical protein